MFKGSCALCVQYVCRLPGHEEHVTMGNSQLSGYQEDSGHEKTMWAHQLPRCDMTGELTLTIWLKGNVDKVVVLGPGMYSISSGGGALGGEPGAVEQVDFDSVTQWIMKTFQPPFRVCNRHLIEKVSKVSSAWAHFS